MILTRSMFFLLIIISFSSMCSASDTRILGYLDPGSGAMIFQMIIASVVGAGVAIKLFWRNILSFFSSDKNDDQTEESDSIAAGEKE